MNMDNKSIFLTKSLFLFYLSIVMLISCQVQNISISDSTKHISELDNVTVSPSVPTSTKPKHPTLTPTINPTITPTPTLTKTILSTSSLTTTTTTTTTASSLLIKVRDLPARGSTMKLSKNGNFLGLVDANDGSIYVYDLESDKMIWKFEDEPIGMVGFSSLDFSPDGTLLVAGGVEKDTFVWDLLTGKLKFRIVDPYYSVDAVSFSPDSQLLSIGSQETYSTNAPIMIYSMNTGELIDKFPSPNILDFPETHQDEIHLLETFQDFGWYIGDTVFIPGHSNLLAITINNPESVNSEDAWALYIWNMEDQILEEILPGSYGNKIAVSPSGELLATIIDSKLHSFDIDDKSLTFIQEQGVDDQVTFRLIVNDSKIFARLTWNGDVTIWGAEGNLLSEFASEKYITDIAFTPDGHLLIAYLITEDGTTPPIELWRIRQIN